MKELVSVIVPIYCVEKYVAKCIQSLTEQTYNNIEIILVDDGSPDNCGAIIDEFKKIDDRIIAIHKRNEGVSAARNSGLDIASGDYIMFVDGDDYVEPDYVEYFVSILKSSGCEIAVNINAFHNEEFYNNIYSETIVESEKTIEMVYLGQLSVAVWNKIYKKSFLEKTSMRFNTDLWYAEGMLFNILCLQQTDNVFLGNKPVYHVVSNPLSATRKFNLDSHFCGLRSMELQRDSWKKRTQGIMIAWEFHYRRYAESIIRGLIKSNTVNEHKKIYKKCRKASKANLRIPIQADIHLNQKLDAICFAIGPEININEIKKYDQCCSLIEIIDLFCLKIFNVIPRKYKKRAVNFLGKYYRSHYKSIYIYRSLL